MKCYRETKKFRNRDSTGLKLHQGNDE